MGQRSVSAVGVIIVFLFPLLLGGAIFVTLVALLGVLGVREFLLMSGNISPRPMLFGYVLVPAFAFAAFFAADAQIALGICALAVGAPFVAVVLRANLAGSIVDWSLSAVGTIYLGIPVFAAVATRRLDGTVDRAWMRQLAERLSFGWQPDARGLAWALTILLATWMSDTGAYLVGRSFGKRPLIPIVSPKKTVEGLLGGLAAAAVTGLVCFYVFGMDRPGWIGLLVGGALGVAGVCGDLAESVLKRQAGVKDSGTLIPGHGGLLDRLDALLFTWTVGWFLAVAVDRWV